MRNKRDSRDKNETLLSCSISQMAQGLQIKRDTRDRGTAFPVSLFKNKKMDIYVSLTSLFIKSLYTNGYRARQRCLDYV